MIAPRLPSSSDVLLGKYQLGRELGRGGMGVVYEATHVRLGHKVAIKMVLSEAANQPELAFRFEREARTAARLRSRHTARVLDVDATAEGVPFLVMELLEGNSLREELVRGGPLPVGDAVRYVIEACEAMDEAHRAGIIHRDLKLSNLFLARDGGRPLVKVLDFGISKASFDGDVGFRTATNVPLGTCHYMSPEQARSARTVDARTDVWSLGVVLYELLTGEVPFGGDNPLNVLVAVATQPALPLRELRPDAPEALAAAVERALCKDVEGRFPTARSLADALGPFATGLEPRSSDPPLHAASSTSPPAPADGESARRRQPRPDTTAGGLGSAAGVERTLPSEPSAARSPRLVFGAAGLALAGLLGLGVWRAQAPAPPANAGGAVTSGPVAVEPEARAVRPPSPSSLAPPALARAEAEPANAAAGAAPSASGRAHKGPLRPAAAPRALSPAPSSPPPGPAPAPAPRPEAQDPEILK